MADPTQKYSTHIPQNNQKQFPTMIHNQMQTNKQLNDINTHKRTTEKSPYTRPSVIFLPPHTPGTYSIPAPKSLKQNIVHIAVLSQVILLKLKFVYLMSFSPPLNRRFWLIQI